MGTDHYKTGDFCSVIVQTKAGRGSKKTFMLIGTFTLGCSLLISVPVRGYSNILRFPIPAVITVFFRIPVSNYCPKLLFN